MAQYGFTKNGYRFDLSNEIGKGGEGIVYKIDDKIAAKIYYSRSLTDEKL